MAGAGVRPVQPGTIRSPAAHGAKHQSVEPAAVQAASSSQQQPAATLKTSPVRPLQQSVADDGRRTIAKIPPPDSDDEDEVEIIQAFCGRPTRSGRIPRPAVRPSEDNFEQITELRKSPVSVGTDANLATLSAETNVIAVNMSESVASFPLHPASHTTSVTLACHTSAPVTFNSPVTPSALPQVDLNHLPPGYFVVVEVPSSTSSASASGTEQQALYHIFAVDQDVSTGPSMLPPANVASRPSAGSLACQQPRTLSNGNAFRQPVVCGRPVTPNVSSGQWTSRSVVGSQYVDNVAAPAWHANGNVPTRGSGQSASRSVVGGQSVDTVTPVAWHTNGNVPMQCSGQWASRSVVSGQSADTVTPTAWNTNGNVPTQGQSSSCHDVTQICQDLSRLANCDLSVMKQADGTVVIQTAPTMTNRLPQPRPPPMPPLPPTRYTSMKLVPRFPSAQLVTRRPDSQMIPYGGEIVLETNSGRLSDMMREDEDGAQYVDIVVEDWDDVEREEFVV